MANLDFMSVGQAQKETTFNNAIKSLEPSFLYGIKESASSGLNLYIYGGLLLGSASNIEVLDTTISLVANKTNYVEANSTTGAVSVNQIGFTYGFISLFEIITNAVTRTSTKNKTPNPIIASSYSLPEATSSILGGVRIGDSIQLINGKINVNVDGVTTKIDENGKLVSISSGSGGGAGLTFFKESKNTTAPNATIPILEISPADSNSETNIDVNFKRKGNGSYIFFEPGTNKIGRNSVDYIGRRVSANQVVSGNYSFGGGDSVVLSGSYAFLWGNSNTNSGDYSAVFGSNNTVSGNYSYAFGEYNNVTSSWSFASGSRNSISANSSTTFGMRNNISGNIQFMIGEGGNSNGMWGGFVLGGRWDTLTSNTSKGSSQSRILNFRNRITSLTPVVLSEATSSEGINITAANQISLVANQAKFVKGTLVMSTNLLTKNAVFEFEAFITRSAGVATTTLVSSSITPKSFNNSEFNLELYANTTLGSLAITCSTSNYTENVFCQAFITTNEIIAAR